MKNCKHRLPWNEDWHCRRRGWLFGQCTAHFLETFRWERRSGFLSGTFDLGNINRPYLTIDDDRPIEFVGLSWGNGNSDPVWQIEINWRKL